MKILVLLIGVGFVSPAIAANAGTSDILSETLLQSTTSWDGTIYAAYPAGQPQPTVLRITIPPHQKLRWHTHPMPSVAYVLSGEIIVEKKDGPKRRFSTGDVIAEMVDTLHRGVAGEVPVVLLVFYAGVKDMPLSKR